MKQIALLLLVSAFLSGCATSKQLVFQVTNPDEHLMHSIAEGGIHPHWYDGCRGQIPETGETILIWWNNNAIRDTGFAFSKGKTYVATFQGDFGDDFVEGKGKSLEIGQLVTLKEKK